jgi:hypothetical protein
VYKPLSLEIFQDESKLQQWGVGRDFERLT